MSHSRCMPAIASGSLRLSSAILCCSFFGELRHVHIFCLIQTQALQSSIVKHRMRIGIALQKAQGDFRRAVGRYFSPSAAPRARKGCAPRQNRVQYIHQFKICGERVYRTCFKRLLDILLSGLCILIGWPVLAVIALAVKLDSPGPVFFRQQRVGRGKALFPILKFRTMRTDTPKDMPTHLLQDPDAFITRTGHFLRRTSLDELPQLFNIFAGQMAIVGPRPALYNQYDLIAERDRYGANDVRPGLTGLAQVSGRDELPIPVKAKLDGEYVKHITFVGDLRLIWRTVGSVARSEGIVEGAQPPRKEPK